jgi:hypothetical protein
MIQMNTSLNLWKSYKISVGNPARSLCSLLSGAPYHIGHLSRPIIWIGHSFGGMAIQEILIESEEKHPRLFSTSVLCIFYSYPGEDEYDNDDELFLS